MSEHSPLPWRVFTHPSGTKLVGVGGKDGQGILDAGFGVWAWDDPQGMANAALIVRAVNAHAQLVETLEKVNDWLVCHSIASDEDMAQSFPTMCKIVNDALASLKENA
jgi:hypothetical protein